MYVQYSTPFSYDMIDINSEVRDAKRIGQQ